MSRNPLPIQFIIPLGGPGTGKGTLIGLLMSLLPDVCHLECSHLLGMDRTLREDYIDRGRFVKDSVVTGEIDRALRVLLRMISCQMIILDGCPRTDVQLVALLETCKQLSTLPPIFLFLEAEDEILLDRIEKRRLERIALDLKPRPDDEPVVALRRVADYRKKTVGLLLHQGLNPDWVHRIDARLSADDVFASVCFILRERGLVLQEPDLIPVEATA